MPKQLGSSARAEGRSRSEFDPQDVEQLFLLSSRCLRDLFVEPAVHVAIGFARRVLSNRKRTFLA